jgi:hypothetical protein
MSKSSRVNNVTITREGRTVTMTNTINDDKMSITEASETLAKKTFDTLVQAAIDMVSRSLI